ncbi:MAG: NAD-dependent epimerase/dehydratase family protein [Gemmataceae bacterium]|nr:NAD-dependent epimerase/dehydratase family protein [Gemmataceae bacterium]
MKCLVTGSAGFIGSHLCERLVRDGHEVVGIDGFIPYYPRAVKERNLARLKSEPRFTQHRLDLRTDALGPALDGVEAIFHLAGMPGLTQSWTDFDAYQSCNLTATHRLLEAVKKADRLKRFIFASTSSVYGQFSTGDEIMPTRPASPYGVTKLAAEHLCHSYQAFDLPLVVLRFFSVYGPRQRPDMGYFRFINAMLEDQPITVFGDGLQVRGNTYIDDCIDATALALNAPVGETYNLGGSETASVWDILQKLERILGRRAAIYRESARPGDQRSTFADTSKLRRHLGWQPKVILDDGLERQVAWQKSAYFRPLIAAAKAWSASAAAPH